MTPIEKARAGLSMLKEAIVETIREHPDGLRNAEVADLLDLRSDYQGGQQDYLSWSVIGLLLNEGKVERKEDKRYVIPKA